MIHSTTNAPKRGPGRPRKPKPEKLARVTPRGRELAHELGLDPDRQTVAAGLCSLLVRHGTTYQRIQVEKCNGHPANGDPRVPAARARELQEEFESYLEKRDETLTRQITDIVRKLAEKGAPVSGVDLGGDPRGCTVKLIRTDGRSNSWGGESRWCIPMREGI